MKPPKGMTPDEELNDLQKKYHLLEGDRKAYYETSQWTIKQNRDTLAVAKKENKELRAQLAAIQAGSSAKGSSAGKETARQELKKLTEQVAELRKKYDDTRQKCLRIQAQVDKQEADTKALEIDAGVYAGDTDAIVQQHIRILENRLDKALIKYNEAQSIKRTYEQIVRRLREERITFDNQLAAIGRTLKAKEHDLDDLVLMSHEANHAKEIAKGDLARVDGQIHHERAQRERDLADRRSYVLALQNRAKQELSARMEMRDKNRKDLQYEMLEEDAASEGRKPGETQGEADSRSASALDEVQKKITSYEDAFRKIREATGLTDVNEVIQKFMTQEETATNLKHLTRETQAKIDRTNEETAAAKAKVEEVKYSGSGVGGGRRLVDEYEARLADANASCERAQKKYERVAKILVNMKAGTQHVADKLEVIKTDQPGQAQLTDESIAEVLQQCEQRLIRTLDSFAGDDELARAVEEVEMARSISAGGESGPGRGPLDQRMQNNMRIGVNPHGNGDEDSDAYFTDDEEDERDVPDRLFVKAASLQMMERAAQRFKKKMGRFSSMAGRPSSGDYVHGSDSPLSTLSPNWNSSTPPPIKGKVSQGKKADPE